MFGKWKWLRSRDARKRQGIELGREIGRHINDWLIPRLDELEPRLLNVFKGQLATINEHAGIRPCDAALIELRIFLEQLDTVGAHMCEDARKAIRGLYEDMQKNGLEAEFDNHIKTIADDRAVTMFAKGKYLAAGAVAMIPGADPFDVERIDQSIRTAWKEMIEGSR